MQLEFHYPKDQLYLVAVSGGPDSMALLDLLFQNGYALIVAHVNYKKRKESDQEQQIIEKYCQEKNIPVHVAFFQEKEEKKSFQVKAREFRYQFFAQIYQKEHCDGLFVAHHFDDLLETYLLKKKRHVINESYLIASQTNLWGMQVYRPLLSVSKKDLQAYCLKNHIPFGVDQSNDSEIYLRNQIRHQLQTLDKQKVWEQALKDEKILIDTRQKVRHYLSTHSTYQTHDLKKQDDLFLQIFLYETIQKEMQPFINRHLLSNLKNFLWSKKPNLKHKINKDYYMIKAYSQIEFKYLTSSPFCYVRNDDALFKTPYFEIRHEGLKMQGIYLTKEDFPIQIRSYKASDKIELKNGTKKISRLFIDKKVPKEDRIHVPVLENKDGKILLVSGFYRYFSLKLTQNNYFVIEYKK